MLVTKKLINNLGGLIGSEQKKFSGQMAYYALGFRNEQYIYNIKQTMLNICNFIIIMRKIIYYRCTFAGAGHAYNLDLEQYLEQYFFILEKQWSFNYIFGGSLSNLDRTLWKQHKNYIHKTNYNYSDILTADSLLIINNNTSASVVSETYNDRSILIAINDSNIKIEGFTFIIPLNTNNIQTIYFILHLIKKFYTDYNQTYLKFNSYNYTLKFYNLYLTRLTQLRLKSKIKNEFIGYKPKHLCSLYHKVYQNLMYSKHNTYHVKKSSKKLQNFNYLYFYSRSYKNNYMKNYLVKKSKILLYYLLNVKKKNHINSNIDHTLNYYNHYKKSKVLNKSKNFFLINNIYKNKHLEKKNYTHRIFNIIFLKKWLKYSLKTIYNNAKSTRKILGSKYKLKIKSKYFRQKRKILNKIKNIVKIKNKKINKKIKKKKKLLFYLYLKKKKKLIRTKAIKNLALHNKKILYQRFFIDYPLNLSLNGLKSLAEYEQNKTYEDIKNQLFHVNNIHEKHIELGVPLAIDYLKKILMQQVFRFLNQRRKSQSKKSLKQDLILLRQNLKKVKLTEILYQQLKIEPLKMNKFLLGHYGPTNQPLKKTVDDLVLNKKWLNQVCREILIEKNLKVNNQKKKTYLYKKFYDIIDSNIKKKPKEVIYGYKLEIKDFKQQFFFTLINKNNMKFFEKYFEHIDEDFLVSLSDKDKFVEKKAGIIANLEYIKSFMRTHINYCNKQCLIYQKKISKLKRKILIKNLVKSKKQRKFQILKILKKLKRLEPWIIFYTEQIKISKEKIDLISNFILLEQKKYYYAPSVLARRNFLASPQEIKRRAMIQKRVQQAAYYRKNANNTSGLYASLARGLETLDKQKNMTVLPTDPKLQRAKLIGDLKSSLGRLKNLAKPNQAEQALIDRAQKYADEMPSKRQQKKNQKIS